MTDKIKWMDGNGVIHEYDRPVSQLDRIEDKLDWLHWKHSYRPDLVPSGDYPGTYELRPGPPEPAWPGDRQGTPTDQVPDQGPPDTEADRPGP